MDEQSSVGGSWLKSHAERLKEPLLSHEEREEGKNAAAPDQGNTNKNGHTGEAQFAVPAIGEQSIQIVLSEPANSGNIQQERHESHEGQSNTYGVDHEVNMLQCINVGDIPCMFKLIAYLFSYSNSVIYCS